MPVCYSAFSVFWKSWLSNPNRQSRVKSCRRDARRIRIRCSTSVRFGESRGIRCQAVCRVCSRREILVVPSTSNRIRRRETVANNCSISNAQPRLVWENPRRSNCNNVRLARKACDGHLPCIVVAEEILDPEQTVKIGRDVACHTSTQVILICNSPSHYLYY